MQIVDYRAPYSPHPGELPHFVTVGHVAAGALGLAFLLFGGVAVVRLVTGGVAGTTSVAGVTQTLTLAVIEVIVGLVFLSAATAPWSARATLIAGGVATVALGLLTTLEPTMFGSPALAGTGAVIAFGGITAVFAGWSDRPLPSRRR